VALGAGEDAEVGATACNLLGQGGSAQRLEAPN
jgi:hypothetical protein